MEQSWSTRFRFFMLGVMLVATAAFIWYVRVVIAPLIISALCAYILAPVVEFLVARSRMSKRRAVAIVFFLALTLLLAFPASFFPIIISEAQTLIADLDKILLSLEELLARDFFLMGQTFRLDQFIPDMTTLLSDTAAGITDDAFHIIEATTRNLLWVLVILASTYSLLSDGDRLRRWAFGFAPPAYQGDLERLYEQIKQVWRGYLRGNLALMTVTGILFTLAWVVIGVPGAIVLGLIAGLLTIIPDLGPAIAAVLAILVSLVEGSTYLPLSNFWFAMLVLGVYLVLINIKNIWIRPRIFGRSVHMHHGVVFVAIVAAVVVEGILGALVVIPVLASAGVIGGYIWRRILGEPPFPDAEPASHAPPDPAG